MSEPCEDCSQLEAAFQNGAVGAAPSQHRLPVLIGCGLVTGAILASALPFLAPALRKVCLPFVPSTDAQVANVFRLLSQEGRAGSLVDLGSGDGRIVFEASRRSFRAEGVELNFPLVLFSRTKAALTGSPARFHRKDLWKMSLSPYDNVVIFGVESMMTQLERKLCEELKSGGCFVACRFPLPTCKPVSSIEAGSDSVWMYRAK